MKEANLRSATRASGSTFKRPSPSPPSAGRLPSVHRGDAASGALATLSPITAPRGPGSGRTSSMGPLGASSTCFGMRRQHVIYTCLTVALVWLAVQWAWETDKDGSAASSSDSTFVFQFKVRARESLSCTTRDASRSRAVSTGRGVLTGSDFASEGCETRSRSLRIPPSKSRHAYTRFTHTTASCRSRVPPSSSSRALSARAYHTSGVSLLTCSRPVSRRTPGATTASGTQL